MPDATDIGGGFSQVGGSGGVLPPVSTGDTPAVQQSVGFTNQDTISNASIDAALMMQFVTTAQYPILIAPSDQNVNGVSASDLVVLKTATKFQEIASAVLDAWSESIKKLAEEQQRRETDPDHIAKLNEERDRRLGLVDHLKSYVSAYQSDIQKDNNNNIDTLSFVTSSLVITGLGVGIGAGVVDVVSTSQVAVTPQVESLGALASQTVGMFPGDARAELGLIGTLMMTGAFYAANADQIADKQGGKVVDQMTLATNYANKILNLVGSDQLESMIRGVLGDRYDPSSSAMVKVVMLASSLAALYKADAQWITGQELTDLIKGNMTPANKLEQQVVQSILEELSKMSDTQQNTVLAALGRYMDSNPKFESFFDIGNMLDNVAENITAPPDTRLS